MICVTIVYYVLLLFFKYVFTVGSYKYFYYKYISLLNEVKWPNLSASIKISAIFN